MVADAVQRAPVAQWSTVLFGEPKSSGLSSRRPRVRFPPGALRNTRRLDLVERHRPAREEVERLLGLGAHLGGEGEHRQPGVAGELHRLVAQLEVTDDWVMHALDAG